MSGLYIVITNAVQSPYTQVNTATKTLEGTLVTDLTSLATLRHHPTGPSRWQALKRWKAKNDQRPEKDCQRGCNRIMYGGSR